MSKCPPKISVIVPVYNVEKYIAACLESLIVQTLPDIEIICVDDCSTDGSVEIIRQYIKKDKRIKLICKDKNSGQSDSRNIGLSHVSAPYIMFCDSDDFYAPSMCEKMLKQIQKPNVDLAICGMNIIYEANKELKESDDAYYKIKYTGTVNATDNVIRNCDVSPCNKIFKKAILDKHAISFPTGLKYEDAYFFNVYVLWVSQISFLKDKLYTYIRHANSTMACTFKKNADFSIDHLTIAIKYFEYLQENNLYKKKFNYFWKDMFIPMFYFVIRYCRDKKTLSAAFDTARDFINKNYQWGKCDFYVERTIAMIANGTLERPKTALFGLIRTKERPDSKKIRFCGIPVYQIKYFPDYRKHYLLGIQYLIKHLRDHE